MKVSTFPRLLGCNYQGFDKGKRGAPEFVCNVFWVFAVRLIGSPIILGPWLTAWLAISNQQQLAPLFKSVEP